MTTDSKWSDPPDSQPPRQRSGIWLWVALALAVAVAVVVRLVVPTAVRGERGSRHPAVGAKVTTLSVVPLTGDGPPLAADSLAGKVTLLNFWGTWCPPCAVEFPHLVEIERHFRGRPEFQFVSISSSGGRGDDANIGPSTAQFLVQMQADFPTYRDPQAVTRDHLEQAAQLRGFAFPTTVVIGPDATIRALWTGYAPGDERELEKLLESELKLLKAPS
ncbi:MAG: TlpA disulfide reductase family protein [Pirellulaceae bacterium]|nr:TlpA disulfide reductase family protein [Pirellulaceae bacterium]